MVVENVCNNTSLREELHKDILEGLLIHHSTGAFLKRAKKERKGFGFSCADNQLLLLATYGANSGKHPADVFLSLN